MRKFQLSSFYPDGLRQNFDLFKEISRKFHENLQNFPILKQVLKEHSKRHLLSKFEQTSIFTKISKMILIFFYS
jgi:hypothetical protein